MTQPGVAFTWSDDGDVRSDSGARRVVSDRLGLSADWAVCRQVHGARAHRVVTGGTVGEGDALVTDAVGVPLAMFTADCLGVVMAGDGVVGVAHAGWRGLSAGVLEATVDLMTSVGSEPSEVHIGPAIGPCCFEVGDEVAALFPADRTTTTWNTTSVDLVSAAKRRLGDRTDASVSIDGRCTRCEGGFSHRRDGTSSRMAAIGWLA